MIGLGTLLSALGVKLVTDVVSKKLTHDVIKHKSPLIVVYANGPFVATRRFTDHSRAVAFQREVAKRGFPSHLIEATPDGRLNMDPILTMNGLGDTWIRSNYALPKGPYSSAVAKQGKQGRGLVHANEYQAQAWADEYGPHYASPTTAESIYPPFYTQSYGSTYHDRTMPKDTYSSAFYKDGSYNLVNPHNT